MINKKDGDRQDHTEAMMRLKMLCDDIQQDQKFFRRWIEIFIRKTNGDTK
jgi:hypothetical protein